MGTIHSELSGSRKYLIVVCPCGRSLRASFEQVGSTITCWECQQPVSVPLPRATIEDLFRALRRGWSDTYRAVSFGYVFLASAIVSAALCVERVGVILGTAALILIALGYGELIRRGGTLDGNAEEPGARRARLLIARGLAAVLLGLGLGGLFLLSPNGMGHAARLGRLAWPAVVAGLVLLPLAMLTAFARDASGPLGVRRVAGGLARHPLATLTALMAVPAAAVFAESILFALSYHYNILCFFLAALFPDTADAFRLFGIPYYQDCSFGFPADERFLRLYVYRLSKGYTLLGAIPPSLMLRPDLIASPWTARMTDSEYLLARLALTIIGASILFTALGLQARWLALIATLDSSRDRR